MASLEKQNCTVMKKKQEGKGGKSMDVSKATLTNEMYVTVWI